MEKSSFNTKLLGLLKFLGLSLGISAILVVLSALYTWITGFSFTAWSERIFWFSLVVLMLSVTPALASLNDKNDYKRKPEQAQINMVIGRGEKQIVIEHPGRLALRFITIGFLGIGFSALIDLFSH